MAEQQKPISWGDDDKDKKPTDRGNAAIVDTQQEIENIARASGPMIKGQYRNVLQLNAPQMRFNAFGGGKPVQLVTLVIDEGGAQLGQKPKIEIIEAPEAKNEDKGKAEERYTNDISSYQTDEKPGEVLKALVKALVESQQDMEIDVNEDKNTIKGIIFVQEFDAVDFQFNIWEDAETGSTRFELQRNDGNAMAAAKFLGEMQRKYFVSKEKENDDNDKQTEKPSFSCISLSVDASKLDLPKIIRQASNDEQKNEKEDSITKEELDEANAALSDNELNDAVDSLSYIYERLKENGAVSKDVVNHDELVTNVINEAMKNKDLAVSRGCLLIINELCSDEKIGTLMVEQNNLFENLQSLLQHKYDLMKLYTVAVLSKLATLKKWNLNKEGAQKMEKAVKDYENKWKKSMLANNPSINQEMFESIYKKLGECQ